MTQRLHYQRPAPAWVTAHKDWNPGGYRTLGKAAQQVGKSPSSSSAGLTVSLTSPAAYMCLRRLGPSVPLQLQGLPEAFARH